MSYSKQRNSPQFFAICKSIIGIILIGNSLFAFSATKNVEAQVEFVAPVAITENNGLQFGMVSTELANLETILIATDNSVTDTNGRVVGGTQLAAKLTVNATSAKSINIVVNNINGNNGYGLDSFQCSYNGGAAKTCDGAGTNETAAGTATLEIGARLVGDGNTTEGIYNGSFDVLIAYN